MNMSMAMDMGGMSMPAMTLPGLKLGADLAVTAISPAGDLTYTMGFTGMTVEASAYPTIAAQLQAMSDLIKTVTGSATLSSRGVVRTANIGLGRLANSQLGRARKAQNGLLLPNCSVLAKEILGHHTAFKRKKP